MTFDTTSNYFYGYLEDCSYLSDESWADSIFDTSANSEGSFESCWDLCSAQMQRETTLVVLENTIQEIERLLDGLGEVSERQTCQRRHALLRFIR